MRMNQGVEWAVHASTLLASLAPGRGLSLNALAEFHGVPAPYLAKQMQLLSKAGIVRTSRGKTGGYALARAPSEITLWQIARAVDGAAPMFRCAEIRQRGPCPADREQCRLPCGISAAFARAESAYRDTLEAVSVAAMLAHAIGVSEPAQLTASGHWLSENLTRLAPTT
jgi:Rrf2 family protein